MAARLRTAVAVLAAAGRASALFFELKPGSEEECFAWKPDAGHRCVGSYEADGPEEGIVVRMVGPEGNELWRSADSSGHLQSVDAHSKGESYKLCFKSTISEIQMVSFDARWGHDYDHELDQGGREIKQFVTQNHTDQMKDTVAKLYSRVLDITEQQEFAIPREAVHRETAESTNTRVVWWTVVEAIFLVALAIAQVYILRSYFEVKTLI